MDAVLLNQPIAANIAVNAAKNDGVKDGARAPVAENATAPRVGVGAADGADEASATVKITLPLKELAKIVAEHPSALKQAQITFADGKATLTFPNGKIPAELLPAPAADNAPRPAPPATLLDALAAADNKSPETTPSVEPPRPAALSPTPPATATASAAPSAQNFAVREILLNATFWRGDEKLPLPLPVSPANFVALAQIVATLSAENSATIINLPPTALTDNRLTVAGENREFSLPLPPAAAKKLAEFIGATPVTAVAGGQWAGGAMPASAVVSEQWAVGSEQAAIPASAVVSGQWAVGSEQSAMPASAVVSGQWAVGSEQAAMPASAVSTSAVFKLQLPENLQLTGEWKVAATSGETLAKIPALDRWLLNSGLTPSAATRAAATALLNQDLPVDRANIQTLLATVAGRGGDERAAMLEATARLLRLQAPVSVAVVSGDAELRRPDVTARIAVVREKLQSALAELSEADGEPWAVGREPPRKILQAALSELAKTPLPAEDADLPEKLRNFFRSYARENVAKTAALIEDAATQILRRQPELQKIDAALNVILAKLDNADAPPLSTPKLSPDANSAAPRSPTAVPPNEIPPRAPQLARWGNDFGLNNAAWKLPPYDALSVAAELKHPGVEPTPLAWRDLAANPDAKVDLPRLENALRQIFSGGASDDAAMKTAEIIKQLDRVTLRELAATLQAVERDEIAAQPALSKLADAAGELRDLGRMFTAMKMENLATDQQNPALMSATIPFQSPSGNGDGKLQIFYKRGGGKKGWSQRVVLDLAMSALGDVIGDLRFTLDKKLSLVVGAESAEKCARLSADQNELIADLAQIGFFCQPEFRVVTAPSGAPAASAAPGSITSSPVGGGKIDIKA
ncbi:MAG: hypothetical protein LBP75_04635 [Planctomycetota bacterium]|jgi:hypothetical protein|nr:hypothetical protein [Planctomycetota bacterium]